MISPYFNLRIKVSENKFMGEHMSNLHAYFSIIMTTNTYVELTESHIVF